MSFDPLADNASDVPRPEPQRCGAARGEFRCHLLANHGGKLHFGVVRYTDGPVFGTWASE